MFRLSPESNPDGTNVYPIAEAIVPVLRGEQHYFVWSDKLINFCFAPKNSNNAPEIEALFLKDADRDKRRTGLPNVPAEYKTYLLGKPLVATVSEIKRDSRPRVNDITLSVGTADDVVPGIKFYAAVRNIHMMVEILETGAHSPRVYVIAPYARSSKKTMTPRVRWKLTSRAPQDASNYFSG